MRFWLTKGLGKPIQEQLSSQLLLGILSGQLKPGQRLPSLRHLARRLGIHANTVSIVYGDLCERGWLVSRPGSGAFVAERQPLAIETFVEQWTEAARSLGYSREQLIEALTSKPRALPCLVVDPDLELARILAAELSLSTKKQFQYAALTESTQAAAVASEVWCNPGHATTVSEFLGGQAVRHITLRSVDQLLVGRQRPDHPVVVAIVSRSKSIRDWAAMLLPALGVPSESILTRDPGQPGWRDGLTACGVIGADIISEQELSNIRNLHQIRIVAP